MTVTREMIVAEARSWIGTPFRHQAQLKGKGCDCKGFVTGVATALGLPEAASLPGRTQNYSNLFRGRQLLAGLREALRETKEEQPGDVLAIIIGTDRDPRHLAFVSFEPGWIIHAYGAGVKRVAEVPLGDLLVHSRWTWPSLGGGNG